MDAESPISSGSRPHLDDWKPPGEFDEYRLVRPLGRGSMGLVFLAHDRVLDRPVAIKFISSVNASASDRERFLVEARAAARLHHPNIMAIYRVGELDGNPYLVCEYIHGKSLNDLELPVSWQRAHKMAIAFSRGLANAHRHGVLHRDIKLANMMVVDGGEVKILDFSLAKLIRGRQGEGKRGRAHKRDRSRSYLATNAPIIEPGVEGAVEVDDAAAPGIPPSETDQTNPAELEGAPAEPLSAAGPTASPGSGGFSEAVRERIEALTQWRDQTVLARGLDPAGGPDLEPRQEVAAVEAGWMNDSRRAASLTQVGALMGTPHYMAPELWHGEPASRGSDVYAAGIVLYALVTGRTPYAGLSLTELATAILAGKFRPVVEAAPAVDPRFASIIERCLRSNPGERYASGDELRSALELLTPVGRERQIPTGNPYRGLRAFEAEHRALFFGRSVEIRAVVERLRGDFFVLVAGDSGVGKSSLCRAGVVPLIQDGAIEPERAWAGVSMMPGRKPLQMLVSTLAGFLGEEEERLDAMIRDSPVTFGWYLRKQLGQSRGLVIFLDQLEELVTIADSEQAALVGGVFAQFAAGVPGVRLLASGRGDFLTRVAEIPELGEEISRAIYLLRPLTRDGAREAIAGPAELQGVRFESEALISDLIDAGVQGSLPLLQFALAELWEVRDVAGALIIRDHLGSIGGVTGALARHGDGALAALFPQQRVEARRLLLRLVTIEDTRANLSEEELVSESPEARAALEALVRARLLVIRETADGVIYEIAHEALVSGWGTLRGWLDEEREGRILLHSLETAAGEWERLGKPRDALWGTAALTRAGLVLREADLRPRERAFLAASRGAVARGRRLRRAAIIAVPVILMSLYGGVKVQEYRALQAKVGERISEAKAALDEARSGRERLQSARGEAFALFDRRDSEAAEERWAEVVSLGPKVDESFKRSLQSLEGALILDPGADDARALLAATLYERALLAEGTHDVKRVTELRERLALYDEDGKYSAAWDAPGKLRITTKPTGTSVTVARFSTDQVGRHILGEARDLGKTPLDALLLDPGSYLFAFSREDLAINYPLVVQRGEELEIGLEIPDPRTIPDGFILIPAGRFLYGSADEDALRTSFFYTAPLHLVTTGAYLIGRTEVTFSQWITFLNQRPAAERALVIPRSEELWLAEATGGGWELHLREGESERVFGADENVTFATRTTDNSENWLQWPAVGVTWAQAEAYVEWLASSGVTGARVCSDVEWERAARGADARIYTHADALRGDEANYDATFGVAGMGPIEVGRRAASRSPFAVDDMIGNAHEWVARDLSSEERELRGGSFFFDAIMARIYNRAIVPLSYQERSVGVRVCANAPT